MAKRGDDCEHHWMIDEANGPTSEGRCRWCGSLKNFFNFTKYLDSKMVSKSEREEEYDTSIRPGTGDDDTWPGHRPDPADEPLQVG